MIYVLYNYFMIIILILFFDWNKVCNFSFRELLKEIINELLINLYISIIVINYLCSKIFKLFSIVFFVEI